MSARGRLPYFPACCLGGNNLAQGIASAY